jgi:hypothetical protein
MLKKSFALLTTVMLLTLTACGSSAELSSQNYSEGSIDNFEALEYALSELPDNTIVYGYQYSEEMKNELESWADSAFEQAQNYFPISQTDIAQYNTFKGPVFDNLNMVRSAFLAIELTGDELKNGEFTGMITAFESNDEEQIVNYLQNELCVRLSIDADELVTSQLSSASVMTDNIVSYEQIDNYHLLKFGDCSNDDVQDLITGDSEDFLQDNNLVFGGRLSNARQIVENGISTFTEYAQADLGPEGIKVFNGVMDAIFNIKIMSASLDSHGWAAGYKISEDQLESKMAYSSDDQDALDTLKDFYLGSSMSTGSFLSNDVEYEFSFYNKGDANYHYKSYQSLDLSVVFGPLMNAYMQAASSLGGLIMIGSLGNLIPAGMSPGPQQLNDPMMFDQEFDQMMLEEGVDLEAMPTPGEDSAAEALIDPNMPSKVDPMTGEVIEE